MKNPNFFKNRDTWLYRRGDIYFVTLNPRRGSEQGGWRPVLVVQNDVGNHFSTTLVIAPMTSRIYKKDDMPTHYRVERAKGLRKPSLVLLEQIRTIDKERIKYYMGCLDKTDMDNIDNMIRTSLGLYLTRENKQKGDKKDV